MQETSCPNDTYITDLLDRARKLREAGQRLIQEADSLWLLARSARQAEEDQCSSEPAPRRDCSADIVLPVLFGPIHNGDHA